MNKRFIWNFEFDLEGSRISEKPPLTSPDKNRWEARFFWPDSEIITIYGLKDSFLDLSQYQFKKRNDTYMVLPDIPLNLKMRRDLILYKPLIKRTSSGTQYGKKIKFKSIDDLMIPEKTGLNHQELIQQIKHHAIPVSMSKETVTYKFSGSPKLSLEFARIRFEQQIYFSLGIESKSLEWVRSCSEMLLKNRCSTDYIDFIKNLLD